MNMDLILYNAILKCDVDIYQQFKGKITEQLTSANHNTVVHIIAQHHDCPGCVNVILSDQSSQVVKFLLTWKNLVGDTALCIAARNNRIEMLKVLIERAKLLDQEHGRDAIITHDMLRMANDNGDTALHEAVKHKCSDIVKLLVEADPDYKHMPNNMMKTPLYLGMDKMVEYRKSFDDILEAIISTCSDPGYGGPAGETVLHAAARSYTGSKWIGRIHQKNSTIVRQLDDRGFTPLHHATSYWLGNDLAEELLKVNKSMAYVRAVDDQDRMTALHLVARQGNESVMEKILEHCPDCWDMTTSNGRNILHLASEKRNSFIIRFILMQPWSVNLINQVDKFGNTPLHLLLHSVPYSYGQIKDLVEHPKVDFYVINVKGDTPYDMVVRLSQTNGLTPEQISIMEELQTLVPLRYYFRNTNNRNDTSTKEDDGIDQKRRERLEEMRRNAERHLVVAALIATVTFAAGFTLPGGYDGNSGPNQGMAVSINKAAFKTFVVTNTLAVISSYAAIFLYFAATFYKHDKVKLYNRYESALVLLLFSMITMVIAFITGMFTILDKSLGLAVTVCIIGSLGILFLLYLVYNTYQDLKSHNRNPFEFRPLGIEV